MAPVRLGTLLLNGIESPVMSNGDATLDLGPWLIRTGAEAATVLDLVCEWRRWRAPLLKALEDPERNGLETVDVSAVAFCPPINKPPKLICIGVNYRDHLEEMGVTKMPDFPYAFMRPGTSLAPHNTVVRLPEWPKLIDWEAELGIVIGRRCRSVEAQDALGMVAGYTIVNDLSARDWIESRPFVGIDWVMQKAWDQFQPTGPWLTPADEVADPQDLAIELTVNGVTKQKSNTGQMLFGVAAIIEHLSAIMTLEPGDIIATGTPAGVGFGRKPRECLKAGDVVKVTVGDLGTLETTFAQK